MYTDDDMRHLVQAEGDWANRLNGHTFSREHDLEQIQFLLDLIRRLAPEMYKQAIDKDEAGEFDAGRRDTGARGRALTLTSLVSSDSPPQSSRNP